MKRFLSEKDFDLAEIREITGDIIKDSTRAGEVIRKLRLLLNKGELKLQRVDICEIINETAAFVKNELALDKIELSLSCAGPQYVMADQIQLQQVMLNLIRNACDALESCPRKKIHITSEGTTPDKVLIAVRDSGKGFKEKDIELVFKPFYTSKETGMGMGLAISKRIIEAHGGRMWARNHPRGGAVVFIELQKTTGEQKT
jgi:two-component system sensor kinase FixL